MQVLSWAAMIIQLFLAVAAVWYTIETRQLRLQNQEQLRLLKEQTRLSLAPYLVPGLIDSGIESVKNRILGNKEMSEEKKQEAIDSLAKTELKFVVAVNNPTSKTGHNLNAWIYDSRTKNFLESDTGEEWIAEKDLSYFTMSPPYFSDEETKSRIRAVFGTDVDFALQLIDMGEKSYILLVFRDIEGRVYAVKRHFQIDKDGDAQHESSSMHFAI